MAPRSVATLLLLCVVVPAAAGERILDPRAAQRIENLLADAEVALAARRLTTPAHDNAYDRFRQVMDFLPDDPRARAGLARISDAYFGLALAAAERRDRPEAQRLFELGRDITPEHPSTATVADSLQRLLRPPLARLELSVEDLAARGPGLARRLHDLGAEAKADMLLAVITAPRDDLARWIYQQMNAAPPNVRLRARSEIGQPAAVELRAEP